MEANFSEPRSLFSTTNKAVSPFNMKGGKPGKIKGLPFNYATNSKSTLQGGADPDTL